VTAYATIAGQPVTRARIELPATGAWWADVDCELAPDVSGRADLVAGDLRLSGTVEEARTGTFGQRRTLRLVGGAGAWGSLLGARHYHNDAGVRARTIIEDAAREAGETVAIAADVASRSVGVDYVREAGPASRALRAAAGSAVWWVDLDGTTRVASARPTMTATPGTYEVLEHDPRARRVTLALDDLTAVGVGSTLTERLDEPVTITELTLFVEEGAVRASARYGAPAGQLAGAVAAIVRHVASERLWGRWRYRVVRRSVDRLELQPVRRDAGLPDALPISMWPGIAGSHAAPALGAEVLVEFIEGDRAQPIVTGFSGKDGTGHVPDEQTFSVGTTLRLGGSDASSFAAKADAVLDRLQAIVTGFNSHTHSLSPSGSTGTPTALLSTPASVAASKARVA
jgi:hypothetical protein